MNKLKRKLILMIPEYKVEVYERDKTELTFYFDSGSYHIIGKKKALRAAIKMIEALEKTATVKSSFYRVKLTKQKNDKLIKQWDVINGITEEVIIWKKQHTQ